MDLYKIYRDLINRDAVKKEVETAKKQFQFKPFVLEYRPLKKVALVSRWGLALFSIATGYGCLYFILLGAMPFWLAGLLAALLLLFVEVLKSFLATLSLRGWYTSNQVNFIAVPALLGFCLSVFLSMQGVQALYISLDGSKNELQAAHGFNLDSLNTSYSYQIKAVTNDLNTFKHSVTYKGKINIHNKAIAATIDRLGKEIEELKAEQRQAVNAANLQHQNSLIIAEQESGFNLLMWVCISLCVELSIVACIWFLVFYAYRVSKESDMLLTGDRYTVNISDLRSFAETVLMSGNSLSLPVGESKRPSEIGFKRGVNEGLNGVQEKTINPNKPHLNGGLNGVQGVQADNQKQQDLKAFLGKYQNVVQAIEQGASNKEMVENCGVSLSTVHNVKRCLKNLEL